MNINAKPLFSDVQTVEDYARDLARMEAGFIEAARRMQPAVTAITAELNAGMLRMAAAFQAERGAS